MKKKGFIRTTLVTLALAGAITGTAFAAEVPLESLPCNATCESHILVQNLIEGTLTDVQNGLGFGEAMGKAQCVVLNAVLSGQNCGYGYADLAAIARNAIFQHRDMYLRPDVYAQAEPYINSLIADIVTQYKNGEIDYNTAVKTGYERVYQTANPDFNMEQIFAVDSCYRDMPAIDSVMFTMVRKALLNA